MQITMESLSVTDYVTEALIKLKKAYVHNNIGGIKMPDNTCMYDGKSYSEGAEICQGDTIKRCIGGKWVDLGRECPKTDINQVLQEIPMISEDKVLKPEEYKRYEEAGKIKPLQHTAYADKWSMQRDGSFLYFKGAFTPGEVCSNSNMHDFAIPLDDLIDISPDHQCRSRATYYWKEITYR